MLVREAGARVWGGGGGRGGSAVVVDAHAVVEWLLAELGFGVGEDGVGDGVVLGGLLATFVGMGG